MQVGAVIGGKYRLTKKLGEGGMGEVWAANNTLIDRNVAIKVMLPSLAKNQEALKRFFNEARVCASIRDPGIVDTLDLGTAEDGAPFIVMELLDGQPFEDMVSGHSVPLADAIAVLRDVAQTLSLAHDKGIVHRDLKPANIFLHRGPKGARVVKILDFGISKVLNETASAYATRTGSVLGSPAYMSPEQAAGKVVDERTDIYALGVILYECVAGRTPFFDAPNMNALLVRIATEAPPRLQDAVAHAPLAVARVVERAMSRFPADRFSALQLVAALDAAAKDADVAGWVASAARAPGWERPLHSPASDSAVQTLATAAASADPRIPSNTSAPISRNQPPQVTRKRNPLILLGIGAVVAATGVGGLVIAAVHSAHGAHSGDASAVATVPAVPTVDAKASSVAEPTASGPPVVSVGAPISTLTVTSADPGPVASHEPVVPSAAVRPQPHPPAGAPHPPPSTSAPKPPASSAPHHSADDFR